MKLEYCVRKQSMVPSAEYFFHNFNAKTRYFTKSEKPIDDLFIFISKFYSQGGRMSPYGGLLIIILYLRGYLS